MDRRTAAYLPLTPEVMAAHLVGEVSVTRHPLARQVRRGRGLLGCARDPVREAVFLVAGDKSGRWQAWYRAAIPLADTRFTEHLAGLKEEESS